MHASSEQFRVLTPLVNAGRELEAKTLAERRRGLNEDIVAVQGSNDDFTLLGSVAVLSVGIVWLRVRAMGVACEVGNGTRNSSSPECRLVELASESEVYVNA